MAKKSGQLWLHGYISSPEVTPYLLMLKMVRKIVSEHVTKCKRDTQFQSATRKEGEVLKIEDDALVTALKDVLKIMVESIVKTDTLPVGLWDALLAIKEYIYGHISHHYAYHVHSPKTANAFLPLIPYNKLVG
jgi:hypothetical protein